MKLWLIRQYRGFRIWFAVRFNRPLNVKWLGAHGNYPEDDHDDTEAFQRACAMIKPRGGVIHVPAGLYNAPPPPPNVQIRGVRGGVENPPK